MIVHYSEKAKNDVGLYYENYIGSKMNNDMTQRGANFSKISQTLRQLDRCLDQTYVNSRRNFIDIDKIATVEFEIIQAKGVVIIKSIHFSESIQNNQTNQNYQQKNTKKPVTQTQSNKITWKFLKNAQFHHGFAIVQATNYRGLYNFVKQDKKTILSPSQWFKTCENFIQWKNGAIMAKVSLENDPEWRFVNIKGVIYKKDKKTGKYIIEQRRIDVFDEKLLEHVVSESIDKMLVKWYNEYFDDREVLFYL